MNLLIQLNNYLHDFSAALWVATLLCGVLLRRAHSKTQEENGEKGEQGGDRGFSVPMGQKHPGPPTAIASPPSVCPCLFSTFRALSRLFWASLAGVVLFGVVRALAYAKFEWVDALGASQVALLAIKHAIFALAVVAGIIWWRRAQRRMAG
ncbi:MAG: hypothetical protein HYY16_01205 [Planctomycetes bacterium]|nr:hypothetical protein [Planctomycetota bacterium]